MNIPRGVNPADFIVDLTASDLTFDVKDKVDCKENIENIENGAKIPVFNIYFKAVCIHISIPYNFTNSTIEHLMLNFCIVSLTTI